MKLIDANTGTRIQVGQPFENVHGRVTVEQVDEGLLSASARVSVLQRDGTIFRTTTPLIVRFIHPDFLFQKVAFLPS